jgi:hypothetical protein
VAAADGGEGGAALAWAVAPAVALVTVVAALFRSFAGLATLP